MGVAQGGAMSSGRMSVLRWFGFVALLAPAGAGAFFALMFAGLSTMGFDSPSAEGQAWPYLLVAGAAVTAIGSAFLVVNGLSLMIAGRANAAYASLALPAVLAGAFACWIRLS